MLLAMGAIISCADLEVGVMEQMIYSNDHGCTFWLIYSWLNFTFTGKGMLPLR